MFILFRPLLGFRRFHAIVERAVLFSMSRAAFSHFFWFFARNPQSVERSTRAGFGTDGQSYGLGLS
jgi:hypothetical protein